MKKLYCLLFVPLLFVCSIASAQNKVITGKVTNKETGEPMQGVNILADKAKGGAITKADGTYSISVK